MMIQVPLVCDALIHRHVTAIFKVPEEGMWCVWQLMALLRGRGVRAGIRGVKAGTRNRRASESGRGEEERERRFITDSMMGRCVRRNDDLLLYWRMDDVWMINYGHDDGMQIKGLL